MKIHLLISLIFLSFHAMAQTRDCSTLWERGFPYPGQQRVPFTCQEHPTGNPDTRLYYPASEITDHATLVLVNNVNEALNRSWNEYNSLGGMPEVVVVLYTRPHMGDGPDQTTYAEAVLQFAGAHEACPVMVYPAARTFSADGIKQLIAHELFHCFQRRHLPGHTELGAGSNIGLWWLEGSAQYFSNWVYPATDLEYSDMFAPFDFSRGLTGQAMGYGNVHFFQSFANQKGPRSLLTFMQGMPSTADGDQSAALNAYPEIGSIFHKFAQDMTAHTLRDEGRHIGNTPRVTPSVLASLTTDEGTQERQMMIMPQIVSPYRLHFPEKGNYHLQWVLPEGAEGSYRFTEEEGWRPLPEVLETNCTESREIEVLVTTTQGTGLETAFVYADREEDETKCPCEPTHRPTHSCLFGTWEVDQASIEEFMRRMMGPSGVEVMSSTGSFKARFSTDGTVEWILNDWVVKTRMKHESRRGTEYTDMTQITNGTASSRYSNQGRSRICAAQGTSNVTSIVEITTGGRTYRKPGQPILPTAGMLFTYECSGNEMIYKEAIGAGPGGSNVLFNYRLRKL